MRDSAPDGGPSTYLRRLLVFLSVATFFKGYGILALAQILPACARLRITPAQSGSLLAFINLGTVIAYLLIRVADRIGRKRVLSITIVGYTLASLASAASPNAVVFGLLQCIARVFLIGEWTIAMVFAAEEYPPPAGGPSSASSRPAPPSVASHRGPGPADAQEPHRVAHGLRGGLGPAGDHGLRPPRPEGDATLARRPAPAARRSSRATSSRCSARRTSSASSRWP